MRKDFLKKSFHPQGAGGSRHFWKMSRTNQIFLHGDLPLSGQLLLYKVKLCFYLHTCFNSGGQELVSEAESAHIKKMHCTGY